MRQALVCYMRLFESYKRLSAAHRISQKGVWDAASRQEVQGTHCSQSPVAQASGKRPAFGQGVSETEGAARFQMGPADVGRRGAVLGLVRAGKLGGPLHRGPQAGGKDFPLAARSRGDVSGVLEAIAKMARRTASPVHGRTSRADEARPVREMADRGI